MFIVPRLALSWNSSCLCNRTPAVTVNSLQSQHTTLHYGVPQGSILGPVLFILYTQPLFNLVSTQSITMLSLMTTTLPQTLTPPLLILPPLLKPPSRRTCLKIISVFHSRAYPLARRARARVRVYVIVCVCVVSVIVKRPVLPPCAVDRRSRNPVYYY